ncbi:acyltransferase family protein [Ectobacillus sp. sgz5001026]|uniref:acyltransferase family protein n=1 Tax=Ectobacillus sp. sgz5001026 TaxID=3242473 RepID=UPI0036D2618E
MQNKNRLVELDSLRGLASLTVVMGHFTGVYSILLTTQYLGFKNIIEWLKFTPLHIVYAGHEAVLLFFILSGFVLTLPFLHRKQQKFIPFMIKRIFRIYTPIIVMVLIAVIAKKYFYDNLGFKGLSDWINLKWSDPISFKMIFQHVTLIFQPDFEYGLNPVLWSLSHEVRVYFILPFLVPLILKLNWKTNFVICGVLLIIGALINKVTHIYLFGFDITVMYIPAFIIGIMLAKYRDIIKEFYIKRLNISFKIALILVAVLLYTYTWLFPNLKILHNTIFNEGSIMIGASLFIVIALSSKNVSSFLSKPILVFFGKISYSLYLYHFVVLLSFLYILYNTISTWMILIIAFCVSLIVSYLSYKYIETPSNQLARRIVSKLSKKGSQVSVKDLVI